MPVFVVHQIVSHPAIPTTYEKKCHIIGKDLRHAIEKIRAPEYIRQKLDKHYYAQFTEIGGRTTRIEIMEELKG